MRVLHVVHAYAPSVGGSQQVAQQVSERMVATYGDQVTVYTTVADDLTYFWRGGAALPAGVTERNGVTVERFPVIYQGRWLRKALAALTYRLRLPTNDFWRTLEQGPIVPGLTRRIATSGADVILAQSFPLLHMYQALAGATRSHTPLVMIGAIHLHDRWGYDRPMIYRAMQRADAVVAYTTAERDALTARGVDPARLHVIGAGVDPAPFTQATTRHAGAVMRARYGWGDDPVVAVLAKQVPRKRFDLLLQAMPALWAAHPRARLLMAGGRTTYSPTLDAQIAALPPTQASRVTVIADFADADKPALIDAADVVVLPSAEESFGIVLVEAWAGGKPVIGAGVDAVAALIDHGVDGLHYAYPDPGSLAAAITTLLAQPSLAAQMGAAGRAKVHARYTWDQVTAQLRDLCVTVMHARQRA